MRCSLQKHSAQNYFFDVWKASPRDGNGKHELDPDNLVPDKKKKSCKG